MVSADVVLKAGRLGEVEFLSLISLKTSNPHAIKKCCQPNVQPQIQFMTCKLRESFDQVIIRVGLMKL